LIFGGTSLYCCHADTFLAFLAAVVLLSVGVLDGVVSGAVLGLVWRGAVVVADKIGLKKEVEKARDRLR
jgi:hypothetical protein